jgi:hypothetical protein
MGHDDDTVRITRRPVLAGCSSDETALGDSRCSCTSVLRPCHLQGPPLHLLDSVKKLPLGVPGLISKLIYKKTVAHADNRCLTDAPTAVELR